MEPLSLWAASLATFLILANGPQPAKETIVLLPDAAGKRTGIVVTSNGQTSEISEPFKGIEISGGKLAEKNYSATEIENLFPDVMQALPAQPRTFVLDFEEGDINLTTASSALIEDVRTEIAKRNSPEVTVVGHTDRIGSNEDNLILSLERANKIKDILITSGIADQIIETVGRGELAPLVNTDDEVAEPLNRRVEITIR
ncbi:MAG: OmpA family protein [Sideroxydans sp.]|nr:OmpA family protein [Sideroxydans sp.]